MLPAAAKPSTQYLLQETEAFARPCLDPCKKKSDAERAGGEVRKLEVLRTSCNLRNGRINFLTERNPEIGKIRCWCCNKQKLPFTEAWNEETP